MGAVRDYIKQYEPMHQIIDKLLLMESGYEPLLGIRLFVLSMACILAIGSH